MENLVGKTVLAVKYSDPWENGLRITFTDGTTLEVTEARQAGEVKVSINNKVIKSEFPLT
jgi:hypothetical protein